MLAKSYFCDLCGSQIQIDSCWEDSGEGVKFEKHGLQFCMLDNSDKHLFNRCIQSIKEH